MNIQKRAELILMGSVIIVIDKVKFGNPIKFICFLKVQKIPNNSNHKKWIKIIKVLKSIKSLKRINIQKTNE